MKKLEFNLHKWFADLTPSILALYNGSFSYKEGSLLEKTLSELLGTNFQIWIYEDEARRMDISDKDIADLKRNIDKANQKRNDTIDSIDEILREDIEKNIKSPHLPSPHRGEGNGEGGNLAPLNSETPGSIFDRLTILHLRTYNLKKETERKDADKSHIERCIEMLKEVEERSDDLLKSMEDLLLDYYSGNKTLKSYRQHKLYNDPALNPSLRK